METTQHEMYEYARHRVHQKKGLFFHAVLFFSGSLFMFLANKFLNVYPNINWYIWGIAIWSFFFIIHTIKVFVIERFMNHKWERKQIDKLTAAQEARINELKKDFDKKNNTN